MVLGPNDGDSFWQPLPAIASLADMERQVITSALRDSGGNQTRAAVALKVERHRLGRMIRRLGLQSLIH